MRREKIIREVKYFYFLSFIFPSIWRENKQRKNKLHFPFFPKYKKENQDSLLLFTHYLFFGTLSSYPNRGLELWDERAEEKADLGTQQLCSCFHSIFLHL